MYIKEYHVKKWESNKRGQHDYNNNLTWFSIQKYYDRNSTTGETLEYHTIEIDGHFKYKVNPHYIINKDNDKNEVKKVNPNLHLDTFLHFKEVDLFNEIYNKSTKLLNKCTFNTSQTLEVYSLVEEYGKIFTLDGPFVVKRNAEPYKVLTCCYQNKDTNENTFEDLGAIIDFKDGNVMKIVIHAGFEFGISERKKILYSDKEEDWFEKEWLFVTYYYVTITNKSTNHEKKYYYRDERYGDPNEKNK